MKAMKKQHGWTLWGLLGAIVLITFFALLFMKLFPAYFDNMKIREGLQTLAKDPRLPDMTRTQIVRELDNILYIDFAHEIVDLREALAVSKTRDQMTMRVDYEVVIPMVYNISALLEFNNEVQVSLR
jgi:flagellar biogenesis protein FliO